MRYSHSSYVAGTNTRFQRATRDMRYNSFFSLTVTCCQELYASLMGNCFSTRRAVNTQSHDITGEQSSRNNVNNTTLASTSGGSFGPTAQIFAISGSQFTEVHGNHVCNSCRGVKISTIMAILRSTTIMQQLLLMLYHLCLL